MLDILVPSGASGAAHLPHDALPSAARRPFGRVAMTEADFADFLTDISVCFTDGDFRGWQARIRLPFSLVTKSGPVTLETEAALLENFNHYLDAMGIMKVDMIDRRPRSIEICDDTTVIGTYETDLLCRGHRLVPPYTSSALLHRDAGTWRMSSIMNALGHHHWTGKHPYLSGDDT